MVDEKKKGQILPYHQGRIDLREEDMNSHSNLADGILKKATNAQVGKGFLHACPIAKCIVQFLDFAVSCPVLIELPFFFGPLQTTASSFF